MKKIRKNFFCSGDFTSFMNKSLHIGLWEVGTKRPLKGVRNTNTKKSYLVKQNSPRNKLIFTRQFYTLY